MPEPSRFSTGNPELDALLGGGLLPGTLTVVVGATGIGKTQLGVSFAAAGSRQEGRPGIICDMCCRGDSQNHADYADRLAGWTLSRVDPNRHVQLDDFFAAGRDHGDYLRVFDYQGRRVTRDDLDWDAWQAWKAELIRKLGTSIAFFYGNFTSGVRRAVLDGIEPVDRASESIQMDLVEYVYHQVLRKDSDWVARDLFRQRFREQSAQVDAHAYDPARLCCLLLCTSHEALLDELIERPLEQGDLLANANTLIYMGKVREGRRLGKALYVAKHRGSYASDEIVPYTIDKTGIRLAADGG